MSTCYIFIKHTAYKHKGTYSAVMCPIVSISVRWPFLLSVSFGTKTQHMGWVLELISKDEQKQELGRTQLVHWRERGRVNYKPPEREVFGGREGWAGTEGLCSLCLFKALHFFFCVTFQTILTNNDKIQKASCSMNKHDTQKGRFKSQDCTIGFPGRGCAPARCRKWRCICWADAALQLLQFCLQPEREIEKRKGDKGKLSNYYGDLAMTTDFLRLCYILYTYLQFMRRLKVTIGSNNTNL